MKQTIRAIEQFFTSYGNTFWNEAHTESVKGILSQTKSLGTEQNHLQYPPLGYIPKGEYVLFVSAGDTLLQKGCQVEDGLHRYVILDTDLYRVGDAPLYRRAWAKRVATLAGQEGEA